MASQMGVWVPVSCPFSRSPGLAAGYGRRRLRFSAQ